MSGLPAGSRTLTSYARQASLAVVSAEMSVAQMTSRLGMEPDQARDVGSVRPDSPVRLPSREASWELVAAAGPSGDMSALLEGLFRRAMPLREAFVDLRGAGCVIKLSIVQWMTPADDAGPGFWLDPSAVQFLADLGAAVDVDQYVDFGPA